MATGRNTLAANAIDGVYVSEIPFGSEIYFDMDFFDALAECYGAELIFGDVSDEIAAKIETEYGIR